MLSKDSILTKITKHKNLDKIWVGFFQNIEDINQCKANNILLPDKTVQVKESETKYRWILILLIGYKQKNKLRNNVKVSKQIDRQIS